LLNISIGHDFMSVLCKKDINGEKREVKITPSHLSFYPDYTEGEKP